MIMTFHVLAFIFVYYFGFVLLTMYDHVLLINLEFRTYKVFMII